VLQAGLSAFEYNIVLNEFNYIEEINKTLVAKVLEAADVSGEDFDDRCSVCIDFDLIKGNLRARNRRQGDSMTPCGMKGSKKIKDIFIDLKIPKDERDSKLIIADDENIIWLEGYRINDKYKIRDSTKKILKITTGRQYE
jgi:tRNA(Ile)-lysidine synthase